MAIAIGITLSLLTLLLVGAELYDKFSLFKRLYHDVFRWHQPDVDVEVFDGITFCSRCKHCGKRISQDEHGEWF